MWLLVLKTDPLIRDAGPGGGSPCDAGRCCCPRRWRGLRKLLLSRAMLSLLTLSRAALSARLATLLLRSKQRGRAHPMRAGRARSVA